jgi:hypothetical protein
VDLRNAQVASHLSLRDEIALLEYILGRRSSAADVETGVGYDNALAYLNVLWQLEARRGLEREGLLQVYDTNGGLNPDQTAGAGDAYETVELTLGETFASQKRHWVAHDGFDEHPLQLLSRSANADLAAILKAADVTETGLMKDYENVRMEKREWGRKNADGDSYKVNDQPDETPLRSIAEAVLREAKNPNSAESALISWPNRQHLSFVFLAFVVSLCDGLLGVTTAAVLDSSGYSHWKEDVNIENSVTKDVASGSSSSTARELLQWAKPLAAFADEGAAVDKSAFVADHVKGTKKAQRSRKQAHVMLAVLDCLVNEPDLRTEFAKKLKKVQQEQDVPTGGGWYSLPTLPNAAETRGKQLKALLDLVPQHCGQVFKDRVKAAQTEAGKNSSGPSVLSTAVERAPISTQGAYKVRVEERARVVTAFSQELDPTYERLKEEPSMEISRVEILEREDGSDSEVFERASLSTECEERRDQYLLQSGIQEARVVGILGNQTPAAFTESLVAQSPHFDISDIATRVTQLERDETLWGALESTSTNNGNKQPGQPQRLPMELQERGIYFLKFQTEAQKFHRGLSYLKGRQPTLTGDELEELKGRIEDRRYDVFEFPEILHYEFASNMAIREKQAKALRILCQIVDEKGTEVQEGMTREKRPSI